MEKITRHVVIDIALDEKIKKHCTETGEKYSAFIRKCIKRYLEDEERPDRYATLERLHLGDPDKKTGIYAESCVGKRREMPVVDDHCNVNIRRKGEET